jgi:hypothetical protein
MVASCNHCSRDEVNFRAQWFCLAWPWRIGGRTQSEHAECDKLSISGWPRRAGGQELALGLAKDLSKFP